MEPDQQFKAVSLHRDVVTAQGRPEPGNEMPVTICSEKLEGLEPDKEPLHKRGADCQWCTEKPGLCLLSPAAVVGNPVSSL